LVACPFFLPESGHAKAALEEEAAVWVLGKSRLSGKLRTRKCRFRR
jgi:hypothetical protein